MKSSGSSEEEAAASESDEESKAATADESEETESEDASEAAPEVAGAQAAEDRLYTLSEVSEQTGISMPTLQRYKKNYQSRIPSVGKGRTQRYPREAFEVFEKIKTENISRRGRPRKSGSGQGRRRRSGSASEKEQLLTLTRISEETGISYPTLVRYVKLYSDQIPHKGTGRSRRYYPEAVEVFKRIRSESPRGRQRKLGGVQGGRDTAGLVGRVKALEKTQSNLERQIRELIKQLKKPLKVTIDRR